MRKILIIQSRARAEVIAAEKQEYERAVQDTADVFFISSLDTDQLWNDPSQLLRDFDALIIGGSGEFDLHGTDMASTRVLEARAILERMTPLIRDIVQRDFPTLGVCFGHQLIGEIFGGCISSDPAQKKAGSFPVRCTDAGKEDVLFSSLPQEFIAQYGHRNSLSRLPEGTTLLAMSEACKFAALRYGTHIYTTQFHPELTREDVLKKFAAHPDYLPEGTSADSLAQESPEASKIIPLFLSKIAEEA